MGSIRVLLADDHALVRAGLRTLLANEPDLAIVGEASTGDEAQRLCVEQLPDVLLLDLRMPGPSAGETIKFLRVHAGETRVVILTACQDAAAVREMANLGVGAYVLKDDEPDAVRLAIHAVVQGGTWFSPAVVSACMHPGVATEKGQVALTSRERELLDLLTRGWDDHRIADQLHLEYQTVRNYLSRLYGKIGVYSRAEAIVWALRRDT